MPRKRERLNIGCGATDCNNNLHCFKATKEMLAKEMPLAGVCKECGADLVDWERVHGRNPADIPYTFRSLKFECVRHHFWHKPLPQRAVNHAKRKGRVRLRERIVDSLKTCIAPAHPYHDGRQTTMSDEPDTMIPFGQHATATCCRKCVEYWHGIPQNRELTPDELDYCAELVWMYVLDRIPDITEKGEIIPPIRRKARTDEH